MTYSDTRIYNLSWKQSPKVHQKDNNNIQEMVWCDNLHIKLTDLTFNTSPMLYTRRDVISSEEFVYMELNQQFHIHAC